MTTALRRLSRMGTREIAFRAVEKSRTAIEAARYAVGLETWSEAGPLRVGSRHRSGDILTTSGFLIDPARWREIAAAIRAEFPTAAHAAVERADKILEGRYDLLGYRDLSFRTGRSEVDWQFDPVHGRRAAARVFWSRVPYLDPSFGDHKIIWELNRHQHWLALGRAAWLTGDARYARRFAVELGSWLDANPPLSGVNWASMLELALRSISWLWALHFFAPFEDAASSRWSARLIAGIERQLDHVVRHLSIHFSPNTHLLGEGLALYVAGRLLSPVRESAARWEAVGRGVLLTQATAQVNPDGGHVEQSTHYHRYALDFYLLALAVAQKTRDGAASELAETTARLASFCRAMADERGRLPVIGDDDGGQLFPICGRDANDAADSLSLASALLGRPDLAVGEPAEEALWMLGGDRAWLPGGAAAAPPGSHHFADSGYVVLRGRDEHAILDVGRHGFLNGGHAHADALSLVLSAHGRPFLIDPGTATYTMDPVVRDLFRSTSMHNTAAVDGRSQSEPAGPFHWRSRSDARLEHWLPDAPLEQVVASHDGYAPVVHRRTVVRAAAGLWIVADQLLGEAAHVRMDLHWHIDPGWHPEAVSENGDRARRFQQGQLRAALVWGTGQVDDFFSDDTGLGWSSPVYGRRVPSPTIRIGTAGGAPLIVVTAIAIRQTQFSLSVETSPMTASSGTIAVIRLNEWETRLSFSPDGSARDLHVEGRSHVRNSRIH